MNMVKNFFTAIYSYMAKRTEEAECQFYVLGLMIIVGYLGFYLIWHDVNIQGYENFTIRLIASLLGLPLLFKNHLPAWTTRIFPLYWYLSLAYLFPFFYSFMMLKNNFSTLWQLNSLVGITILVILVDWLSAIVLIAIGVIVGWFCYTATTSQPSLPLNIVENISTCYISILTFGGFFIHNKSRFQYEKISALNSFTDMIAHEMRTPLVSINMIGKNLKRWLNPLIETYELAKKQGLDIPPIEKRVLSKLPENAASIEIESNQGQQIINMLLANVEGRKMTGGQLETYSVIDAVNKALDHYAFDPSDRNLVKFDTAHDFKIKANDFFTNIIFNLLKNSLHQIKAADKGEITIWTVTDSEEFNELHFKDTARGISKQKLVTLFKPFVSDTRHGTGLGLAFCKVVMESYNGNIYCRSQEGEYAEFILCFPKISKS